MSFQVSLTESATDEPRGFLGQENDESALAAQFESGEQAQDAIQARIDLDPLAAQALTFDILDSQGQVFKTTYFDEVYGWEIYV